MLGIKKRNWAPDSPEVKAMKTNYTFQFDSIDHGTVDWTYDKKVKDKIYHAQYMIKKSDLIVLTELSVEDRKLVQQELFESFAEENQLVRDHNNKKARERRARSKNV